MLTSALHQCFYHLRASSSLALSLPLPWAKPALPPPPPPAAPATRLIISPALYPFSTKSGVTAARKTGVPLADLRTLNSGLKRGKTLPSGPHRLLVPLDAGDGPGTTGSGSQIRLPSPAPVATRYRVRDGDTLHKIARKHQVTVAALRKANGLSKDRIIVGKVLIIPHKVSSPGQDKKVTFHADLVADSA